ncbi:HD-GYP domain-containing protein [Noviherbaspirillum sp. UKPF54]|uniref:HD-GYP domain-containing protein n=1 Tax=Noviherbaspirillum sp. UKPF54 TaxID=2601898 RepID=UPI0011B1495F|nr:HD-GYP domain-containing protein [Noviherbaspirillum sp. UKPF54]QDZ29363.1 HD-GYP domain-containing protein [Noviherbaspirillum sp. UKPF54]
MNAFNKRTAVRIAIVSMLLAAVASPLAWIVAQKTAEEDTVSLALEESGRLLHHFGAVELGGPDAGARASQAAATLAGGLFDIAEIYNRRGDKLALSMTAEGLAVEAQLPQHVRPDYGAPSYQSLKLNDGRWVLRVFVPLRKSGGGEVTGYFEGVRVIPAWQRDQMLANALRAALMVSLASLLCGAAIYPVVVHLSADNARKAREILDSHISMMEALGRAIAKRDSETGAHNFRVAWIAARIAERFGLPDQSMQSLIVGSFLHDIGKISIPDAILRKPGGLDAAELERMHTHVTQGEEIVGGIGWLDDARAVVSSHHEKWDGTGYPRGLAGDAIPLAARIFAVADVFDALCSRRPYKEPMTFEVAMSILEKDTGTHFDPAIMAAFRPIARDVFNCLERCSEEDARRLLEERVRRYFG